MKQELGTGGWTVGTSIAMELDMALTTIGGYWAGALPDELARLVRAVPPDWQADWPDLLGRPGSAVSVLEYTAFLAGTLLDDDYAHVTLAIRDMTAETALARLGEQAAAYGLAPRLDLPLSERLVELWTDLIAAVYRQVGYKLDPDHPLMGRIRRDVERSVRILRDGDLHSRFWHWLDRLYYQVYHPWRRERLALLHDRAQQAQLALAAGIDGAGPPQTALLPAQNPLRRMPELQAAVQAGHLRTHFWVEPFGLADTMGLQPGLLLLSFAEPGALLENFRAFAVDVAARTAALANPTRLTILRIIRHLDMVNTEIAGFLGLAQPTVSVHAKILREAGLIRSRRDGRLVRHEIVPSEVRRLLDDLNKFLDLGPDS